MEIENKTQWHPAFCAVMELANRDAQLADSRVEKAKSKQVFAKVRTANA